MAEKKQKDIILIAVLVCALIILNYSFLDNSLKNFLNSEEAVHVDRVIDGDTIESNGTSIRLLGINTPERGEPGYDAAKAFLESRILNKTVVLEFVGERQDKYGRTLAYIHYSGENVNVESVRQGFANYYFYSGKDKYYPDLTQAWDQCLASNVNLCEKSTDICAQCIIVSSSNSITNNCKGSCGITNWTIKGEGREKTIFNGTIQAGSQRSFSLDLDNSGGTLFLRDKENKLVDVEVF